jgi:hypothetical protein
VKRPSKNARRCTALVGRHANRAHGGMLAQERRGIKAELTT